MFEKYSGEITGVLIAFLGYVLPQVGVPVVESLLTPIVQNVVVLGGLILTYYRRVKRGDVNALGVRN